MTMPAQQPTPTAVGPSAEAVQAPATTAAVEKPSAAARRADRANALRAELAKAPDPSALAGTTDAPKLETGGEPAPAAADVATADDPIARARAERLARIAQMRAKEEEAEAKRADHSASREQAAEIERLRKRVSELEPQAKKFTTPAELFAYAEREGMSAEEVAKELRDRLTNPDAIADRRVKTEADKLREEIAAERKAREELEKKLEEREKQGRTAAEAHARAQTFIEQTTAKKETHPLTAAFLARHGADGYIGYANAMVAPHLREEYSLDELHDTFEQLLDELQLGSGATGAAPTASPASGASQPAPKNGVAKPATTLSSAITAERTTVAEETPLHRLPRAERKRRLKERLERE